ncbi:MAG TPA: hypothetical protein VLX09_13495 [Stellaceae bacterium]|nr:hypothetical protein [Stellaceae bacterium]
MIGKAWWLGAAALLLSNAAEARVTRIEVSRQEPFAGGQDFGTADAYEKLVGRFYGELDPTAPSTPGSSISTRRLATPGAWWSIPPTFIFCGRLISRRATARCSTT